MISSWRRTAQRAQLPSILKVRYGSGVTAWPLGGSIPLRVPLPTAHLARRRLACVPMTVRAVIAILAEPYARLVEELLNQLTVRDLFALQAGDVGLLQRIRPILERFLLQDVLGVRHSNEQLRENADRLVAALVGALHLENLPRVR